MKQVIQLSLDAQEFAMLVTLSSIGAGFVDTALSGKRTGGDTASRYLNDTVKDFRGGTYSMKAWNALTDRLMEITVLNGGVPDSTVP